jgi:alpha-tubulin suppressor-like RCC1 family protein
MNYLDSANGSMAGRRHHQHPSRSSTLQKLWPSASRWLGFALATGSFLFAEPLPAATPLAWGYGVYGQLGDGNFYIGGNGGVATPVQVSGLTTVTAIASGFYHSLALNSDGTVWAWGLGSVGQLGDGNFYTTGNGGVATPVQVSGLSTVTAIAGGEAHSLALKSDGTVWAWGYGRLGQLGDGNFYTDAPFGVAAPVQVSALSTVMAIAGGQYHSLGLKSDGTVWAWGYGAYGQLGDGTFHTTGGVDSPQDAGVAAPVQVRGLSGVVAIAGGADHNLALKSDGTVWAWGYGRLGQLGDGIFYGDPFYGGIGGVATPVQVSGLTTVTAIACGDSHSLALKSDGTVWVWGRGLEGQLGDGNFYSFPLLGVATPVQVSGLNGVVAIAGGYTHSLALKSDGTVWAWGAGHWGQLGDGNFYTTLPGSFFGGAATPVQVIGLSAVTAIAAKGEFSLALSAEAANPPLVITSLTATPSFLGSINNRLTPVVLDVVVNDNGGSTTCNIISVTSSDPIIRLPSGNLEPYWVITGNLSLYLRAGLNTPGVARTYTITVECTDTAGNVATKTVDVIVPK